MKKTIAVILSVTVMLMAAGCSGHAPKALESGEAKSSEGAESAGISVSSGSPEAAEAAESKTEKAAGSGAAEDTEPSTTDSGNAVSGDNTDGMYHFPALTEDKLSWAFDEASGTLTVSGKGPMRDYDRVSLLPEWEPYRDRILKVVISEGVTSVGAYAFCDYREINEAVLPEGLEYIGDSAFDYCRKLWTVTIKDGIKAIGKRAFYNAMIHPGEKFVIPEGCEYIGEEAFHAAIVEGDVYLPSTLAHIKNKAFTNINCGAFIVARGNGDFCSEDGILYTVGKAELLVYPSEKSDLAVYDIPDTVKVIHSQAINVTRYLEVINIPASVKEIGTAPIFWNGALREINVDPGSTFLRSVDGVLFDAGVTRLIAFPEKRECDGYVVPDTVKIIESSIFSGRRDLTAIVLPDGLEEIGSLTFHSCMLSGDLTIPSSVRTIGAGTFAYNPMTSIDFGGSLESLPMLAAEHCENLEKVIIPESVKKISRAAFGYSAEDYPALKEIVFKGSESEWNSIEFVDDIYGTWPDDIPVTFLK